MLRIASNWPLLLVGLQLSFVTTRAEESAAWLPNRLQLGVNVGITASRMKATGDYAQAMAPAPAKKDAWIDPGLGFMASLRWGPWFTLSVHPHNEAFGMNTREGQVSFPGNPFPHTVKASTRVSYNVFPIAAGLNWSGKRANASLQLGVYKAFLDDNTIEWTSDDEPYDGHPKQLPLSADENGWLFGLDYGWRLGPGDISLGFQTRRSFRSLGKQWSGSLHALPARLSLGYAWTALGH